MELVNNLLGLVLGIAGGAVMGGSTGFLLSKLTTWIKKLTYVRILLGALLIAVVLRIAMDAFGYILLNETIPKSTKVPIVYGWFLSFSFGMLGVIVYRRKREKR